MGHIGGWSVIKQGVGEDGGGCRTGSGGGRGRLSRREWEREGEAIAQGMGEGGGSYSTGNGRSHRTGNKGRIGKLSHREWGKESSYNRQGGSSYDNTGNGERLSHNTLSI